MGIMSNYPAHKLQGYQEQACQMKVLLSQYTVSPLCPRMSPILISLEAGLYH